jgi:ribosomal protein S18 acetylase RimI-like enzyme
MTKYYDKKVCKTCNLEKEITCFTIRKDSKDGYRNQCKVCTTKQKNIDKIKNYEKNGSTEEEVIKLNHYSNLFVVIIIEKLKKDK